jgi:hypothetical protein
MQTVLMISEEKLKNFTSINLNMSPADLTPYIYDVQNLYLQGYLGGTLYHGLQARIIAGTLTAPDEYLLNEYIGNYLCNASFYLATTFISYRAMNKGILKGTSENGETLELKELQFLQNQLQKIAEGYAQNMVNYLVTHNNLYPEYSSPQARDGMMPDKRNANTVQAVIPHIPYAGTQRMARAYRNGGYGGFTGEVGFCYNLPGSL